MPIPAYAAHQVTISRARFYAKLGEPLAPGDSAKIVVELPPGTYTVRTTGADGRRDAARQFNVE